MMTRTCCLQSVRAHIYLEYPTLPRTSFIFLAQISLRSLSGLIGLGQTESKYFVLFMCNYTIV